MLGRLEVIDLSAHGGIALAPQELLQQQLQQGTLAASQKADADARAAADEGAGVAASGHVPKPEFSCNTCAGSFADAADYRAHFKYALAILFPLPSSAAPLPSSC